MTWTSRSNEAAAQDGIHGTEGLWRIAAGRHVAVAHRGKDLRTDVESFLEICDMVDLLVLSK